MDARSGCWIQIGLIRFAVAVGGLLLLVRLCSPTAFVWQSKGERSKGVDGGAAPGVGSLADLNTLTEWHRAGNNPNLSPELERFVRDCKKRSEIEKKSWLLQFP
jgi:hypothetical protein